MKRKDRPGAATPTLLALEREIRAKVGWRSSAGACYDVAMGRRWSLRVLGLAGVLLACTSPTLPLPPPSLPTITTGESAQAYHLKSDRGTIAHALVIAVNRDQTMKPEERVSGTIADENGSWEMDVLGKAGDVLDLSQESGATRSPSIDVTLPAR